MVVEDHGKARVGLAVGLRDLSLHPLGEGGGGAGGRDRDRERAAAHDRGQDEVAERRHVDDVDEHRPALGALGDGVGGDQRDLGVAEEKSLDLLEAHVATPDHEAAAALELDRSHVEGGIEHVAHAALVADPAAELADALLALEGLGGHGAEIRGAQASAWIVCSRPISSVRSACHPSRSPAFAVSSAVRSTSPSRWAATSGLKSSRPKAAATSSTSSSTDVSTPVPALIGPTSSLASAASSAATTSAT